MLNRMPTMNDTSPRPPLKLDPKTTALVTIDLQRGSSSRIPAAYWSGQPIWSADQSMLAYSIAADSPPNIVVKVFSK